MNILLVVATTKEITPLLSIFTRSPGSSPNILHCHYKGLKIDVLLTGVGIAACSFNMGKILSVPGAYKAALNVGIAGSFDKKIRIGEVMQVVSDRFSELGAEDGEKFLSIHEIGLIGENDFPFTSGKLVPDKLAGNKTLGSLPEASAITVSTAHGNEESIRKTLKRFDADIESMEGAAFFYACMNEGVACAQIRSISNHIEKRNRDAWNIPLAVESLNRKVKDILDEFARLSEL